MVGLICHAEMGAESEVEHLFIKMTIFASVATPFLKEMFPRARDQYQKANEISNIRT